MLHHRDPNTKSFSIGGNRTASVERILAELEKCELLCPKHHKARHREMRIG